MPGPSRGLYQRRTPPPNNYCPDSDNRCVISVTIVMGVPDLARDPGHYSADRGRSHHRWLVARQGRPTVPAARLWPALVAVAVLAMTAVAWGVVLTRPVTIADTATCNAPRRRPTRRPQAGPAGVGFGADRRRARQAGGDQDPGLNASGMGGQASEVAGALRDSGFAAPTAATGSIYAGTGWPARARSGSASPARPMPRRPGSWRPVRRSTATTARTTRWISSSAPTSRRCPTATTSPRCFPDSGPAPSNPPIPLCSPRFTTAPAERGDRPVKAPWPRSGPAAPSPPSLQRGFAKLVGDPGRGGDQHVFRLGGCTHHRAPASFAIQCGGGPSPTRSNRARSRRPGAGGLTWRGPARRIRTCGHHEPAEASRASSAAWTARRCGW